MPTSKTKPPKRNLAHSVREQILNLMETQEFGPGDPLPSERDLMQRFNVGRPAVREAMQSLQVSGLVEIRHGERAKVTQPSIGRVVEQFGDTMRHLLVTSTASLEHLKDARFAFEKAMAEQAAGLRTEGDIARLRSIVEMQSAVRTDKSRFLAHDQEFHRTIAAISGNPIYAALAEAIFGWLADFQEDLVMQPGREQLTIEEHNEILLAIEERDARRAGKAMHDHLARANVLYHRTHFRSEK